MAKVKAVKVTKGTSPFGPAPAGPSYGAAGMPSPTPMPPKRGPTQSFRPGGGALGRPPAAAVGVVKRGGRRGE